MKTYVEVEV